jgi:LysM repeat protein
LTNDPMPDPSGKAERPFHIFQNGQNLIEIAIGHGVSFEEFLRLNNLTEQSMLFPGQKLKLPLKFEQTPPSEKPTSHSVRTGETLVGIAELYGIPVSLLQKINKLAQNAMLFPGTVLRLIELIQPKSSSLENPPEHCLIHGYHKVKNGDQIARIAAFHGLSTQALLSANNLNWNSLVAPGSKLVLPISHGALDCPNLVELSETSRSIAESLVETAKKFGLTEFAIITALSLEMQRSGLLPDLGIRQQTEKLLADLEKVQDPSAFGVKLTLEQLGYIELAEGAARWEPSAWLWLHQIGSKGV